MAEAVNTAGGVAAIVYERLLSITVENGYETDMGKTVFQGKVQVANEQVIEAGSCVTVIEGIDTVESRPGKIPNVLVTQRYGLVGFAVCDPSQPNLMAHAMLRDLKRVIFQDEGNFGGRVIRVEYLSRDIGPKPDGTNTVMALLEIGVRYVEDLTKP